jgi:ABC-2 type transport system ATP-binding protein
VHRPAVLFLDEPTTGLDPEARTAMWSEISDLTRDGLTILLTTHYLEEADRLAAQVAIIESGRIVVQGSPDGLKSELRGDAVDLELAAVPEPGTAAEVRRRFLALPTVHEVSLDGRLLHARVADGAGALPSLFSALDEAGVAVAAATVARPSLDDVYLRYVGHRFDAQDAAAGHGPNSDQDQAVA